MSPWHIDQRIWSKCCVFDWHVVFICITLRDGKLEIHVNRLPSSSDISPGDRCGRFTRNVGTNLRGYTASNTRRGVEMWWHTVMHGKGRRGNWRMDCVAGTLHTTSEHGLSSITTADAHTSAASSRLNWRPPADLNGLGRFALKTKSGFCGCAITFQLASTTSPMFRTQSEYLVRWVRKGINK